MEVDRFEFRRARLKCDGGELIWSLAHFIVDIFVGRVDLGDVHDTWSVSGFVGR